MLYLSTKTEKMYDTAIPMGKMLNAFLAIHGRCKFIIFLRGQTPCLSAPTLILSLMEHFQGKAKNTVKHCIKSTFSTSIQLNCNWLPGNPQLPPYIYMCVCVGIAAHNFSNHKDDTNLLGHRQQRHSSSLMTNLSLDLLKSHQTKNRNSNKWIPHIVD